MFSFRKHLFFSLTASLLWLVWPLFLSFYGPNFLGSQSSPHPAFRHYTTTDGLPSSEVYCVVQDHEGYIWLSTDNGISKFDGYQFRNYGMADGLKENVVFLLKLDENGKIWMQAMGGQLYYLDNDRIIPYQYNKVIRTLNKGLDNFKGFIVEQGGKTVYLGTYYFGVVAIDSLGKTTKVVDPEVLSYQVYEANNELIKAINSVRPSDSDTLPLNKNHLSVSVRLNQAQWSIPLRQLPTDNLSVNFEFCKVSAETYLLKIAADLIYFSRDTVIWTIRYPEVITHINVLNNGELWIGHLNPHGLRVFTSLENLRQRQYTHHWFAGATTTYFLEDIHGGRWISSSEAGLYYFNMQSFRVEDQSTGLPSSNIVALTADGKASLYVAFANNEIWKLDLPSQRWKPLPSIPPSGKLTTLFYDATFHCLFAGNERFHRFDKGRWNTIPYTNLGYSAIPANRISKSNASPSLWIANIAGLFNFDLPSMAFTYGKDQLKGRIFSLLEDHSGKLWVGKSTGLYLLKNRQLISQEYLHPAFGLRVEAIELLKDSTLVVATKGGGVVFWKGEQLEQIKASDGLTADMLECLRVDSAGNVWIGTLNGLNKISGTWGHRKVEPFTIHHGLPSNEITSITSIGAAIWVGTTNGLVRFWSETYIRPSSKPIITSLSVNNVDFALSELQSLNHQQNNISIQFLTLNYKMNGKIPYRYKINDNSWSSTMEQRINFPQLAPGNWNFQLQSSNEDGIWSASTLLSVTILPAWYDTHWAKYSGVGMLFLLGWCFYYYRIGQLQRQNSMQLQISKLERSALQAQMNPHFIFNCLSAIQNCIIQNEKELSISYLGSFTKLVRGVLNASISERITLQEEVQLLQHYLSLEQLRFSNKFDFEIKVDPAIDSFELEIPPLLIQPYIENAVLHGMTHKSNDGKITVTFQMVANDLMVIIFDNGTTCPDIKPTGHTHKSVGMSITKKRLNILQSDKVEDLVVMTKKLGPGGDKIGTEVRIKIGLIG